MAPTLVYAHNIMLRKGPDFRIYLIWISGEMVRTKRNVNPTFDDPDSFILQIQKGVIHANIGDVGKYLNSAVPADAPLKNMDIQPDGELVKIRGTFKKVVPLPVEVVGSLAATPDGLVRLHVQHISVLKVPVKGLLGTVDVKLADLVHSTNVPGVTVSGNDIIFDTEKLLPPPHIRGQLTTVQVKVPDIEVIYGNASNDPTQLAQWHNFLRFRNGALDFGKLTMHHADLTMIDAADEPWFDLDLVNYLAVGNLNPSPLGYVGGSDVFTMITPAAAQGIASAVNAFPRGAGRMLAIMHALDGALASVPPGGTAFPWRQQSALVQWYVETSGDPSAATNWLNTAHQAVQPYSVGGYVNYIEANQPPSRYFGPNLSRLSAVRQKYDPGRVMFSGLNF